MYSPPINIRVKDNRAFGRKPLVGIHSVKSLGAFKCKLPSSQKQEDSEVDGALPNTSVLYFPILPGFFYCFCCGGDGVVGSNRVIQQQNGNVS